MVEERIHTTVLMSGGIDSVACAHLLRSRGQLVSGLFVDHGQAAAYCEAKAVAAIEGHLALPIQRISLSGVEPLGVGELVGRNAFLIFTAMFATRARPGLLVLGLHAGTPYFDCSEAFISAISKLVSEHTDGRVSVVAPFLTWTKRDVFDYFCSTEIPIAITYSCEVGTEPPCGMCASCRDRKVLGC